MVKKEISDIPKHEEILESFHKGYPIKKICEHFKITYNEFLAVINYYRVPFYPEILAKSFIRDDRVLFIGDTHIGSTKERLDYINETYDFAESEDIHHIVHLGDALQAGDAPVQPGLQDPDIQIEYFNDLYPRRKHIKTHLLLGNHDLKLLDKDYRYMKVINARKDFDILGFKFAYLNWGRHLLSLYHETHRYHLNIPHVRTDLHLEGHKHALSVKGSSVSVPTLSDDIKHNESADCQPGFLLGQQSKNRIDLDYMTFYDGNLRNSGKVYSHRYK